MCAEGVKNSQAKGPVSDEPLESNNKVAPKKQPITKFRVIFQIKMTERRTSIYLFWPLFYVYDFKSPHKQGAFFSFPIFMAENT